MKNTRNLESITFPSFTPRETGIFTFFWDILASRTPIASTRKRVPYVSPLLSRNTNIDSGRESARDYILSGYTGIPRDLCATCFKEIEFKDRDNTDARHPGKARFKWNFNSTSRFPRRYTAEGIRWWNKFPICFLFFPKNTREKNKSPILYRNINDLSWFEASPCSIRCDIVRWIREIFLFLFRNERRALNNARQRLILVTNYKHGGWRAWKKKKKRKKERKKRGMVEQRKIGTVVISKFDGQLPKNVALGAKGSPLARYYRKCTVTG